MGHQRVQNKAAKKDWAGLRQDKYCREARKEKADRSNGCLIFRK